MFDKIHPRCLSVDGHLESGSVYPGSQALPLHPQGPGKVAQAIGQDGRCRDASRGPRLRDGRVLDTVVGTLALARTIATVLSLWAIRYARSLSAFQTEMIDTLAHELHTPVTTLQLAVSGATAVSCSSRRFVQRSSSTLKAAA